MHLVEGPVTRAKLVDAGQWVRTPQGWREVMTVVHANTKMRRIVYLFVQERDEEDMHTYFAEDLVETAKEEMD